MDTAQPTAGTNTPDTGTPADGASILLHGQASAPSSSAGAPPSTDSSDTRADASADDKHADAPAGAPEQYADFTAPEGVTLNAEVLGEFKAMAKERNLSQEDAQKFADLGAKLIQQTDDKITAQIEATQAQWLEATQSDKEYGGDKLTENMAIANKALAAFGTPELTQLLGETKLGNHPEVIRAFYRVGKAISEDRLIPGTTRTGGGPSAQSIYDKSGMNP